MRRVRVIPILLLNSKGGLIKTVKFNNPNYIGDPINAVKIFNEKEVDELVLIDIEASTLKYTPKLKLIEEIVSEAFMPLAYGGGIKTIDHANRVIDCGVEKLILNSAAVTSPKLISEIATKFGSQCAVVSIDVKKSLFGKKQAYVLNGRKKVNNNIVQFAQELEMLGAGELILTNINHEGTFNGYDLNLIQEVANAVNIPVIANGGAKTINDFKLAIQAGASAVAAGSRFVYIGSQNGILINYPDQTKLKKELFEQIN